MTSIGAGIARLGNIGPGVGLAGLSFNYGFLPDYLKWSLGFAMLIGGLKHIPSWCCLRLRFGRNKR
ncbi:MAG: hypothetical protein LBT33_04665 [Spirochaetia bacterium]|jgi:trk system potassium uptake protein TrkH|nr:hypothetical protein [Spirochaetia bacterium]